MMLQLRDGVSAADTDYGMALLDEDSGQYWNLNPTAALALRTLLAGGTKQYELTEPGGEIIRLQMTEGYKTFTKQQIMEQSLEVVRRRIDELGTREPDITRSGDDRILVQVPGLADPQRLITILGQTAKMTFQLVDEGADANATLPGGETMLMTADRRLYEAKSSGRNAVV